MHIYDKHGDDVRLTFINIISTVVRAWRIGGGRGVIMLYLIYYQFRAPWPCRLELNIFNDT